MRKVKVSEMRENIGRIRFERLGTKIKTENHFEGGNRLEGGGHRQRVTKKGVDVSK